MQLKIILNKNWTVWAESHLVITFFVSHGAYKQKIVYKQVPDTSLLLLREIVKLCLRFKRLEVNNNNLNPTNLFCKAGLEGTDQ